MANIKVGIKFRPLLSKDTDKEIQWAVDGNKIESTNQKHKLLFDNVFDENSTTLKMYEVLAKPIVSKVLEGYNGTIFAYGQTSSGKTYSMIGDNDVPGIVPLAISDIFKEINDSKDQFKVRVGYIEIYNDKVFDLLDHQNTELKIFESQGNAVTNQKEFIAVSEYEVLKYFHLGNNSRRIGETSANERSSRSHAIFQITIECPTKMSNLYLVDLAGSEKPDTTNSSFNEGININKSLLSLGKIIRGLSKKTSSNMINVFRECKLTRILSPALGGNSLTAVICTVSSVVFEETYYTICFAQNAKKVKVNASVNLINGESKLLKSLRTENLKLKEEIFRLSSNFSTSTFSTPTVTTPMRSAAKKRLNNMRIEACSPKRLKFELEDEFMMELEDLQVVQQLVNKVADVELEAEEKIAEIIEKHHKEIEHKDKIIKILEEGLLKSRNKLIEVKHEYLMELHHKNEEIKDIKKCFVKEQAEVTEMKAQIELKTEEILTKTKEIDRLEMQLEVKLEVARCQIAELEEKIIVLQKETVIQMTRSQEIYSQIHSNKDEEIENSTHDKSSIDYGKTFNKMVKNFLSNETNYQGDFKLTKETNECYKVNCVSCESVVRLEVHHSKKDRKPSPRIVWFTSHFKTFHKGQLKTTDK